MTKIIALDDGHGIQTSGKRTPVTPDGKQMRENEFNKRVIQLLDAHLKRAGFKTVLVAPTDADTSLSQRVKTANNAKADLYVSVHANANTGNWGSWGGIETYTYNKGESLRIGKVIHKYLLQGTQLRDRGVKDGSWLYVIKNTSMPAVLVEAGFMDNLYEARLLMSEAYRQETAEELARAICEAYAVKFVAERPATPKPAKTAENTFFRVVTGSFSDRKNAEERISALDKKGFDSFLTVFKKDGKTFFRVVTGSFTDKDNAEDRLAVLKQAGFESFLDAFKK
jgi:N-acetylmuramoyl-L-alanine amidase